MKEKYLDDVLKYLKASKKTKRRIKDDLRMTLDAADNLITYDDIKNHFGSPEEMAKEFMNNLDYPQSYYGITIGLSRRAKPFEFISKRTIFGIPLVHINISGRYGVAKAKGIIAVGDISVGIISVGGIAVGLLSIGGIAAGLVGVGGIAAGIIALGGISAGYIAIGGIAVGTFKAIGEVTKLIPNALVRKITSLIK